MAAELRHTLTNLEVTPPTGAWDAIASRLDTEFDAEETILSQKIEAFEIAPPIGAWENIAGNIEEEKEAVTTAPVVRIKRPFRRWAVAAAAIIIVAAGGWYILDNYATIDEDITVVPKTNTNKATVIPSPQPPIAPDTDAATAQVDRPLPRRTTPVIVAAKNVTIPNEGLTNNLPEVNPELLAGDLPHAGPQHIHSIRNLQTPSVEAPPIRDRNGNIILDKELIFAPDNNYIIVTGPNGEQTRISSKFLPLLTSMNGSTEGLDYFHFILSENNIWKLRFDQWREKMMKQASFIPTATNLLDMLELKEILQEN